MASGRTFLPHSAVIGILLNADDLQVSAAAKCVAMVVDKGEGTDACAEINHSATGHLDREVTGERLRREERAGNAVDVVRALLLVVEDEHALVERQNDFLQVGARLRVQGCNWSINSPSTISQTQQKQPDLGPSIFKCRYLSRRAYSSGCKEARRSRKRPPGVVAPASVYAAAGCSQGFKTTFVQRSRLSRNIRYA